MNPVLRRFPLFPIAFSLGMVCSIAYAQSPTVPANLAAEFSGNQVELSWTASTDDDAVAGYNLYRNGGYFTTVFTTGYSLPQSDGLGQAFYVVSFDEPSDGESRSYSARSAVIEVPATAPEAQTPEAPEVELPVASENTTPTPPSALSAQRISATEVELMWSGATDDVTVEGYNVYRDGAYITTVSTTNYTDNTAASSVAHSYYIVAFDEPRLFSAKSPAADVTGTIGSTSIVGITAPAPTPEATPEPEPTPGPATDTVAPNQVTGLVVDSVTNDRIAFSWEEDSSDATLRGYNVYRNTLYLSTVFDSAYIDTNVPAGDSVRYSVVAFDSAPNFSAQSATLLVGLNDGTENPVEGTPTPPVTPPTTSTGATTPRLLLSSNNWAEFQWDPIADATAYNIYRDGDFLYAVTPDGETPEAQKYWNTNSYLDCNFTRFYERCIVEGPQSGLTYDYQVTSVDEDGVESAPGEVLEVTLRTNERTNLQAVLTEFSMVFNDEFNGTTLDSSKWNTRLPWGPETIINGENQYFVDSQSSPEFGYNPFQLTGESLSIEGTITPPDLLASASDQPFLSGVITTRDSFNFTYGYVESRVKFAKGAGMLSSFFLFHQWAALNSPEIDIVEYLGEYPTDAFQTYHYTDERNDNLLHSSPTMNVPSDGIPYNDDYHVFSVLWEPNLVVWFIDGEEVLSLAGPEVARQRSYVTMYLVLGSDWAVRPNENEDIFPAQYEIDYVRIYQRPEFNAN